MYKVIIDRINRQSCLKMFSWHWIQQDLEWWEIYSQYPLQNCFEILFTFSKNKRGYQTSSICTHVLLLFFFRLLESCIAPYPALSPRSMRLDWPQCKIRITLFFFTAYPFIIVLTLLCLGTERSGSVLLLLFLLMHKGHLLHFSIEEDHHISKTRTKLINNPDNTPKLPKHKGVTLFFKGWNKNTHLQTWIRSY